MKRLFLIGFVFAVAVSALELPARADAPKAAAPAIYLRADAPLEARVDDLLAKLTLLEKISLMAQQSGGDALKLNLPPIDRLGVPSLRTCDAPEGLRDGPSNAYPMEVVMASTWDPPLIRQIGAAIGQEARLKNRQVVYGPCVNIDRTPQSGRYFENFGEDPYLTSRMAASYITGMQSEGTAACVKHFICNDQELDRSGLNVIVDERAFHEIYLPPFDAAVREGHTWALMSSYSRVNGTAMSVNQPLLTGLLRQTWQWDGLIIPDWSSIFDTAASANAGASIEMPNPDRYAPGAIQDALNKNQITTATIDGLVRPILRTMVRTGLLDGPPPPGPPDPAAVNTPAHRALALKAAQEGVTLLKNEGGLLPLDRTTVKSVAVIGPNAADTPLGGRWSADVPPFYHIGILDGIKTDAGKADVSFAQGCPRTGASASADLTAAAALAAKCDVAVVVVGTDNNYEGEALDPPSIDLPGDQAKLIAAVAAANPKTIVVLNGGTPFLMDAWLPHVPALVNAWYAGQETGTAVAQILFGDVNPSGRLPGTIAHRREDYTDAGTYPDKDNTAHYDESIYVGYRGFDKKSVAPLFPFGFGLSYTTFGYSGLKIPRRYRRGDGSTVSVTVRNTGSRAGDEVAQLYIEPVAPKIDRPVRELKGFQRVSLKPGEKKTVSFPIDSQSFAYWDVATHAWQTDPGMYLIEVGSSSRDLRVRAGLQVR